MPVSPSYWSDLVKETLARYDEALLRRVAGRLFKPHSQWPVDELIERCLVTLSNAPVLDRRLKELSDAGRQVLALIGHSRQPRWKLGNLVELVMTLGHADGLAPLLELLETGLLYPEWPTGGKPLTSFEHLLGLAGSQPLLVFSPSSVAERARGADLALADLTATTLKPTTVYEADGLEYLLRLAVLWQRVSADPLRRTLGGELFKRDMDRLTQDPVLSSPPADELAALPDAPLFLVALADGVGILAAEELLLQAGALPAEWEQGLAAALEALWLVLPQLTAWNARDGWRGPSLDANPFPSAYLLAFMLLARLPADSWARPADVQDFLYQHHPYWTNESVRPSQRQSWIEAFLLGAAYQLRLVQAARDSEGGWLVRLSSNGRWLLGLADAPTTEAGFPRTLLVQPNLEIIAYRQGLTPALITRLTHFAVWKSLSAACTLQLEPEIVYRGLESGLRFDLIVQTLEQHATRPTPPAVLEQLRTWSNKRDRITVYPSALILEFNRPEDLNEALSRGLRAIQLSERLAAVVDDESIDYKHFRLTGSRDYSLPPERCVEVGVDGVTLTVDIARSDLLLETELPRFAEPLETTVGEGKRQYRMTPASLTAGNASGYGLAVLETWFSQRTGLPAPAAVRMLLTGHQYEQPRLRKVLVLHVAAEEIADGLLQWPQTRGLLGDRLGPTAFVVEEEKVEALREQLKQLGVQLV